MNKEENPVEYIESQINQMAEDEGWGLTKNVSKIATVKNRFFGVDEWQRCPCYPQDDTVHGCGSEACKAEIEANGVCHCNLFTLPKDNQ